MQVADSNMISTAKVINIGSSNITPPSHPPLLQRTFTDITTTSPNSLQRSASSGGMHTL